VKADLAEPLGPRDLVEKYSVPGPRYTSYPSVLDWGSLLPLEAWIASLKEDLGRDSRAALYVHIPFCERRCTYCGCNTLIRPQHDGEETFVEQILTEWSLLKCHLRLGNIPLGEVHLGGGTPTYLAPENLERLLAGILTGPQVGCQASIEVDPRVTTREHLAVLARFGFRRLSLGIQDFDPEVQRLAHREQSASLVADLLAAARGLGFEGINFDLIYGLPGQTPEGLMASLRTTLDLGPDRLAFYGYAHVPWVKAGQKGYRDERVPDAAARLALHLAGRETILRAGFVEIGMDHFARPEDGLARSLHEGRLHRNFMGYTETRAQPLLAIGPSAISECSLGFRQNERELSAWAKRLDAGELPAFRGHVHDPEDLLLREHILNVMTRFATDWEAASRRTPFLHGIEERLAPMVLDGLVEISGTRLAVTPRGRPFVRNVAMAFDARLARRQVGTAFVHSKTV